MPQKKISLRIDGELVNAARGSDHPRRGTRQREVHSDAVLPGGTEPGRSLPPVHGGALRGRPAVPCLHHAGAGRHVGRHHFGPAVALPPHDHRVAAGGTQSRVRGVRRQRTLRVAGHGVHHGHHQRALCLQLPPPAGRSVPSALRARPQPLHPVHALRAHLRRDRGSARVGDDLARHSRPHRSRPEPEVGRGEHLHQLRQVRAGLSHRALWRRRAKRWRRWCGRRTPITALAHRRGAAV